MAISPDQLSPAERLLWGYGIAEPHHIDLDGIANDLGADVIYRSLGGCEARLVLSGDSAIISINSSSNAGRQRFSLAHEIAHLRCDRRLTAFACANEDIAPQNDQAKSVEAHANGFASQLILPNYLVDPWMKGRMVSLDTAASLGDAFRTSLTAAAIKVVRRAPVASCVACHSQQRLLWHQRSATLSSDYFVRNELHEETDAFRAAFGAFSGMSRLKRDRADWWISGRDAYRLEVFAQSVRLPDSTVLTLFAVAK